MYVLISDPTSNTPEVQKWFKTTEEDILTDGSYANSDGSYITENELKQHIVAIKQKTEYSMVDVYSYAN